MPHWKFWRKPVEPAQPEEKPAATYRIPPRTDTLAMSPNLDPAQAARLKKLRQRRESVLFDVERSEAATRPNNIWDQRVALLTEAIRDVEADLKTVAADRHPIGAALPPAPIKAISVSTEAPPSVSFRIGSESFRYEEEIDWAERGFQIARSDLQLRSGNVDTLLPAGIEGAQRDRLRDHLAASLFVFATDLRDRAIEGRPQPQNPTLADLAKPSSDHGDWLDWSGDSPEKKRRDLRRAEIVAELERFRREQAKEIEERARWEERLPIARRRLAEIDAEITGLLT